MVKPRWKHRGDRAEMQGKNGREWLMRWLPARAHDNGMFVVFMRNGVGVDMDEVRTGKCDDPKPPWGDHHKRHSVDDDMVVAGFCKRKS